MSNYEMLFETVKTLAPSQGCYSRFYQRLLELTDDEKQSLRQYIDELPKFKDSVDVIMFLEQ